ncbi:hypothetical protein [Prosthecochloris sp.]|uniref:gp53-like domain-containing protein n=1 Tax=Prosthecochloris sp. TaxID=290513 RepID=UPI0025FA70C0|nr:hypothetical protein [Prosthecochloris sp.]
MANLLPVSTYGNVYQIETSDPVLGGPGGIANRQPQQLANRDEWLKNQIVELQNDPVLSALATLIVNAAGKMIYSTGTNTFALSTITAFARTLLDDANASSALSTLGVSGFIKTLLVAADAATARGTLGIDTAISNAIAALVDSSPEALNTLDELAAALGDDPNFATTITNALAAKAPLASPAFTNNPTAPTQASGNNSTRLATTEFVQAALTALGAVMLTGNQIIAGVKTFNSSPIVPDGTASGQPVHFGQFQASMDDNGYLKLPGGLIFQWGSVAIADGNGSRTINVIFPQPFPNACLHVYPAIYGDQQSAEDSITAHSKTAAGVTLTAIVTGVAKTAEYFAIGK